jgi:adenine-specific DNA-methyltransferase
MNNSLNILLDLEERLIVKAIQYKFTSLQDIKPISENELHEINANLLLTSNENVAFGVHKKLINGLISYYLQKRFPDYNHSFISIFTLEENIDENFKLISIDDIPHIIEELHITFLNSQFSINSGKLKRSKSKHYLKEYGAVYTLQKITNEIVATTIENTLNHKDSKDLKCLDFACGTGRFYFEAIKYLKQKFNLSTKEIVIEHIYAVDIDEVALAVLKCKIISLFDTIDQKIIEAISENILYRNALIPNTSLISEFENSFDFRTDFASIFVKGGFDAVFSNPPYYLLKVNKNKNTLLNGYFDTLQKKVAKEINFFKTSGVYQYSIEGMLNYYQISIEMILKMTKSNGQIGIICPASIFADLTSTKLRKHLLSKNKLHFIRYYSESSNLFENVAQSTVIFYLEKEGISNKIKIEFGCTNFYVSYETIKSVFNTNQEIPLIEKLGWNILEKLTKHSKLKDFSFIRNKRGELDLTLYKECIIDNGNEAYRLVRGNMITENGIIDKNNECVDIEKFINKKSLDFKEKDFNSRRLICQQISNIDLNKRMKFTFSEKNDILANSCNYINSSRNFEDLQKLHFILNSELLNWRFKVTSSNNHINNYELDELPIIDLNNIDLKNFNGENHVNNKLICQLYGLNEQEKEYILSRTSTKKQKNKNEITI